VLTSIPSECIRILQDNQVFNAPSGAEGAESSRLLKQILGVDPRPNNEVTQNLQQYKELVYADKWDSPEAHDLRKKLDAQFQGQDPALTDLDLYIENRKWELGA
jgi:predicted ATP-binding protein involved in virulence